MSSRLWMVAITPAFGPFTYNLARIDPNIVRTHTTRGQWPTVTFSIQENISSHKEWSANAPVAFVMFGMVTKSHLVDPDPFGQKWQRCIFIRLLGMEFLRVMNILASKFQLKKISTPRWEGFRFGTTPTIRRDSKCLVVSSWHLYVYAVCGHRSASVTAQASQSRRWLLRRA